MSFLAEIKAGGAGLLAGLQTPTPLPRPPESVPPPEPADVSLTTRAAVADDREEVGGASSGAPSTIIGALAARLARSSLAPRTT